MSFIAEATTNVSIVGGPYAVSNLQVYLVNQVRFYQALFSPPRFEIRIDERNSC